jgi:hypothetical protein
VRIGAYDLGRSAPGTWLTLDPAGREAVLGAALPAAEVIPAALRSPPPAGRGAVAFPAIFEAGQDL